MARLSITQLAINVVLVFSVVSFLLFIGHELHSKQREADGLDISYKRFRKTVSEDLQLLETTVVKDLQLLETTVVKDLKLFQDTAQKDLKLITDTATSVLHIPTIEELEKDHRIVHKTTNPTTTTGTTGTSKTNNIPSSSIVVPTVVTIASASSSESHEDDDVREDDEEKVATSPADDDVREDDEKKGTVVVRKDTGINGHVSSSSSSSSSSGGSANKEDDTPKTDDDRSQDDDVREDDDDVIQEPGEEPRYFTGQPKGTPLVTTTTATAAVETTPVKSTTKKLKKKDTPKMSKPETAKKTTHIGDLNPEVLPVPQDHMLAAASNSLTADIKVDGVFTSTKLTAAISATLKPGDPEQRGVMICNGKRVDSEIIYWKIVPGDAQYESPITPHHANHHDRYLSFEYDQGGWNNVRMSLECLIVVAHAMGRTLIIPPQQHLYLLGQNHQDKHDKKAHDEMGFEDFFDIDLLRSHQGYHVLHMEDFLASEGVTGGLRGVLPPENSTKTWGSKLWKYLNKVADEKPTWTGHYVVFPDHPKGNFSGFGDLSPHAKQRLEKFNGGRSPVFYDEQLQRAHHIHFPAEGDHRILQQHYAFAFFANPDMQSFYRRFVRDYMRYRDEIQCAGAELVAAVRRDSMRLDPTQGGAFYALHIRRGDFQYKDVKLSADEIVANLQFANKTPIIPPGSMVYLSTDDPKGICENCYVNRQPCTSYVKGSKPVGCPEDPSWDGFIRAGWKLRFLDDYLKKGLIPDINPNQHGMVESIVCTRATAFAGTYFSTFTGYIHRLRGYQGLGESTYYHTSGQVFTLQHPKSVGNGFTREWRAGWTDDAGELI